MQQTLSQISQPSAGVPIDYSFRELKQVYDILYEDPVAGHPRHTPLPREEGGKPPAEYLELLISKEEHAASSNPDHKYNSTSLRLCNNQLLTLGNLDKAVYHVLDDPNELVWLDASCNQLSSVEDVILRFPKLQVLYLHGNQITNLHDVLKLAKLEHLVKLTLHGNPIAEHKHYKMWVAAHLPHLRNLDFSTITKVERDKINTWFRGYQKACGR